jgi:aldose 1-epimerase
MIEFIELTINLGVEGTLCTLGASIYDIKTRDKAKKLESIIGTTKDKKDFITERSCLGKTLGRTGGRISNSTYTLNGIRYTFPSYDPNGLHGGIDGVGFKEFDYKQNETKEYHEVIFSYFSKDMESGYPGNFNLKDIYKLYKDINKLTLSYKGISDKDTLVNLSNHSYFNLSCNANGSILNHSLYINASKMERIEHLLPKEIVDCKEIYSFKTMHKIGDYLMHP